MLRLLWIIYLCFDQITKNMEYLTQYLLYPQTWGDNVRKRNYQCSRRTLIISLPKGVPRERRLMVKIWRSRNTVPMLALSQPKTL